MNTIIDIPPEEYEPWLPEGDIVVNGKKIRQLQVGDRVEVRINEECPYWNKTSHEHSSCHTPERMGNKGKIIDTDYSCNDFLGHTYQIIFGEELSNDDTGGHYTASELILIEDE